jgi:predicted transcriptional regulator
MMLHVGSNKPALLFRVGVIRRIDRPSTLRVVVVVAPLCKVIGEFKAWEISISIFEVNDDQLFVLVSWVE